MFTPKITPYDTKIIPKMYQDWYRLITIYDNKIFWEIQQKKTRSTQITITQQNEYIESINYIKEYTINSIIPDYAYNYKDEWTKFCFYWSEKWKTGKIRAESEKTFEIKRRFATWLSRKKETYQKIEKPSVMDITL